jgi:hypothetical protein
VPSSVSDLLARCESLPFLPCYGQIISGADDDHSRSAEIRARRLSVGPQCRGAAYPVPRIQSVKHQSLLVPARDACSPPLALSDRRAFQCWLEAPRECSALSGVRHCLEEAQEGGWASGGYFRTPRQSRAHATPGGAAVCTGGADKQAWEITRQCRDARPAGWVERSRLLPTRPDQCSCQAAAANCGQIVCSLAISVPSMIGYAARHIWRGCEPVSLRN